MGFFSKLFRQKNTVKDDGEKLYLYLLEQARNPIFYGNTAVPDSYEGRIDLLTLHIAPVLKRLNSFGETGSHLGQALFDAMKDDFEIALREEGLTDSGVAKRIKPMIRLFYSRVKLYSEALSAEERQGSLIKAMKGFFPDESRDEFWPALSDYTLEFDLLLSGKTLGELAQTDFEFPEISQ